jgi:hypothetical protein
MNGDEWVSDMINLDTGHEVVPGPNITAFQSMMLSGHGLPEIPEGGSVESLLKSRIKRRLQFVDYRDRG